MILPAQSVTRAASGIQCERGSDGLCQAGQTDDNFQQAAAMVRRNTEHVRSLARMRVTVDDIPKNFEAVDFFHGEHPGVMYRDGKRGSDKVSRWAGHTDRRNQPQLNSNIELP